MIVIIYNIVMFNGASESIDYWYLAVFYKIITVDNVDQVIADSDNDQDLGSQIFIKFIFQNLDDEWVLLK